MHTSVSGWERTPDGGSRPKMYVEHWIKADFNRMPRASTGDFEKDLQRCETHVFYQLSEDANTVVTAPGTRIMGSGAADILIYTAPDGRKRVLFETVDAYIGFHRAIYSLDGICSFEYKRPGG